jgi:hypothetical protein
MEKQLLLLLWLLMVLPMGGFAGEFFTVLRLKGEIFNKTANAPLQSGSKVNPADELEFGSADAEAVAISSSRGKFVIKLPASDIFGDDMGIALANASASPIASRAQYSVRSLAAPVADASEFFGNGKFYIIGDSAAVVFSTAQYPFSDGQFLSLSFQYGASQLDIDVLPSGQRIVLSKTKILPANTHNFVKSAAIYYVNPKSGSIKHISTSDLYFLEPSALKSEFSLLGRVLSSQGLDKKEAAQYMKDFFIDVYGATEPAALQQFLLSIGE